MTIKPQEVATLIVAGRRFDDWESVYVQHRWTDGWTIFRFTATERDPIPTLWGRLQFKPRDECAIYLGGQLGATGVITLRQASYDANSHGVMLQGVGMSWYAARGSIIDKTSNYDNMTFQQVAHKVIAPFGVGVGIIGTLDATPFKRLQCEVGETCWNFLERIARPRGIVLGSDHFGKLLLIGDHAYSPVADLVEGDNILKCQATISIKDIFSDAIVRGQTAGSDDKHGTDASEQEARAAGILGRYSPRLTAAEQPVWNLAEIAARAKNEAVWSNGTEVTANIMVQGWFVPGGRALWRAGDQVSVYSPMAMLNMAMKIQTATFTQDSASGTLTTLDLVAPWLLKDMGDANVGKPSAPPPPADATTNTGPAASPSAAKVGTAPPLMMDT